MSIHSTVRTSSLSVEEALLNTNNRYDEVDSLRDSETGRWLITTEDSVYIVDLDERYIKKALKADSVPSANERRLPLQTLHVCRVGDPGFWTMKPDWPSPTVEYYWYVTADVQRIRRLQTGEAHDDEWIDVR
jgi:hypothetical protein